MCDMQGMGNSIQLAAGEQCAKMLGAGLLRMLKGRKMQMLQQRGLT